MMPLRTLVSFFFELFASLHLDSQPAVERTHVRHLLTGYPSQGKERKWDGAAGVEDSDAGSPHQGGGKKRGHPSLRPRTFCLYQYVIYLWGEKRSSDGLK